MVLGRFSSFLALVSTIVIRGGLIQGLIVKSEVRVKQHERGVIKSIVIKSFKDIDKI